MFNGASAEIVPFLVSLYHLLALDIFHPHATNSQERHHQILPERHPHHLHIRILVLFRIPEQQFYFNLVISFEGIKAVSTKSLPAQETLVLNHIDNKYMCHYYLTLDGICKWFMDTRFLTVFNYFVTLA